MPPSEFRKIKADTKRIKKECKRKAAETKHSDKRAWKQSVRDCICAGRAAVGDPCDSDVEHSQKAEKRWMKECRSSRQKKYKVPEKKKLMRECICSARVTLILLSIDRSV